MYYFIIDSVIPKSIYRYKSINIFFLKYKVENKMETLKKEYLNPQEVSEEFGFSISTLAKWRMKNERLSYSKMGKYIKYKRSNIVEYIEAHTISKGA